MKLVNNSNGLFVVGRSDEIRPIEKAMRRAWKKDRSNIWPSHLDAPIFRPCSIYGLAIEAGERHPVYYVRNADGVCQDILDV